jgi:hypothetical protein
LNEDLAHAISEQNKKYNLYEGIIDDLKRQLESKSEPPALNKHIHSESYQTGRSNQNVTWNLNNTK